MKCIGCDDEGQEVWGRESSKDRTEKHPPYSVGGRVGHTGEKPFQLETDLPMILIIVVVVAGAG